MSEKKVVHPIRGLFVLMKNLFLLASVLIAAFAVVGYFAGWVEFQHNDQQEKATIEIKTQKVKATAKDAVEKGKELFGKASKKVEDAADDTTEDEPESGVDSEPDGDAGTEATLTEDGTEEPTQP